MGPEGAERALGLRFQDADPAAVVLMFTVKDEELASCTCVPDFRVKVCNVLE